jgi:4'-phosphopantetheinyl transferase EntD
VVAAGFLGDGVLEAILPREVASVERFDDPPDVELLPEELAALSPRAVDKRRREYTTVRGCAHEALVALGEPPAPIVPGDRGAPTWPAGLVGSLTHCDGFRAAVVARRSRVSAVGIDAEPHQPLPGGVLTTIARPEERDRLDKLALENGAIHWDRLLFCAKEAVYKAWFPLARRWLGFEDASITLTLEADHDRAPDEPCLGRFDARLLVPGPPLPDGSELTGFSGRWLAGHGLLLTAIAVTATTDFAAR